ncbi:hypothetical protein A1O3_09616 [Capronia epimyces CBS 606.96]|uniref:Auxin efflux carrier n=1 Tax=Capronia epimyces CBS 606.96 TaxID=1182542 RepID=W9XJ86_9EURO|nr:uncharacterized protein A1O3_09616 [Capronia epimyces CBS 606.96]EXJ77390.1 hypothetical protein A1O3_09616 [Capronia epimyces CBS 606.96]
MQGDLLNSFLGALQATVSIVLVIFYGVLATQFKLLDGPASKKISTVCIKFFLPALLITKVGSQLHAGTAARYVPVLIWAVFYTLVSIAIGLLAVKILKLPSYVTPAIAFNNTTSLPLLLIESLGSTGILDRLLLHDDSVKDAVNRAQAYFLVCAVVGNCLTFAVGPRLIKNEYSSEEREVQQGVDEENGFEDEDDLEEHRDGRRDDHVRSPHDPDDLTSLLPGRVRTFGDEITENVFNIGRNHWAQLSPRTRDVVVFVSDFVNPPLIGAILGAAIGLTPPLHRAFFNDSRHGGFFNAWLTISLRNTGQLFVTLQVVVVGVSLSSALRKMRRGDDKGLAWVPAAFILLVRFVMWPVLSIAIIWGLSTRTKVLPQDPMLCFAMMLMPTGPPAMKLVAMGKVNDIGADDEMILSKLLTLSYAVSPILALTVVGSLYASEAAMVK